MTQNDRLSIDNDYSLLCSLAVISLRITWALQLKAMHIPIKPVGADDPKQPVWGHFCQLIEGRSQALSHTFQA